MLPFTIDDVADTLMRKLGNRAPGVLAGESISLQEQMAQWEEGKAAEKARNPRESVLDDVPTGQPALALAQKVITRVCNAGLPVQLIPAEITSIAVSADIDAENCLRAAVLDFSDNVRRAERAIVAARRGDAVAEELDMAPVGTITEQEWLVHWPSGSAGADVAPEPVVDEEPPQEPAEPEEQVEAPAEGETPKESRESRGGSKKRKGRR
ncbi:hypothetical protein MMRN_47970 [Mycobacterium marinum]|nr:hypothetical protein MMRN_47970 [Mycobacterium marinum]